MSTSSYPTMAKQDPLTQMIAHSSLKVAQTSAMIFPPAYLVSSLILRRGSGFSIRKLMRTANLAVAGGAAVGGAAAWLKLRDATAIALEDRVFRLRNNASQIHADDLSIIGAALSAVLVPAVLLKRAPLVVLATGGASIGLGIGSWVHIGQMFTQGKDIRPEGMVGEIPVVGGNGK